MKLTLLFKLAAIGGITLLLMFPLIRIHALVVERSASRDSAVADVARGSGLAQSVLGPVLVIPVIRTAHRWAPDATSHERHQEEYEIRTLHTVLPERLDIDAALQIEQRRRGIYEARLYRTPIVLTGRFILPAPETPGTDERIRYEPAYLSLGVADIRGIGTGLAARIGDATATFESGSSLPFLGNGVHAPVPRTVVVMPGSRVDFAITLPMQGTGSLDFVPAGRETQVTMRSPWPHPSFTGQFLPVKREVGKDGFSAQWQTSFFATNLEELVNDCARRADCRSLEAPRLGVSLIDPVDGYVKSDRAIKYALLFIALTFAGFLLCEILLAAPLHPMHYGLVGLALALFYLLLLSLSEHLGFAAAYAVSAGASVGLLSFYLRHVLASRALGVGFGAGFTLLYALLYGILAAEDYALLMGSLLLFGVLALFMILTRRVDWRLLRAE